MKAKRASNYRPGVLTLTGDALANLDSYLSQGWKLAAWAWGYAFIVKGA